MLKRLKEIELFKPFTIEAGANVKSVSSNMNKLLLIPEYNFQLALLITTSVPVGIDATLECVNSELLTVIESYSETVAPTRDDIINVISVSMDHAELDDFANVFMKITSNASNDCVVSASLILFVEK